MRASNSGPNHPNRNQAAVIAKNSKAPHRFPRRGAFGAFYLVN